MSLHYYDRLRKRDPFMARYCGWTYPAPNLTDALTQRYFTFLWRTDGSREDKGWRVMATRVYPGEAWADPEGGGDKGYGPPPPPKYHKIIEFSSNIGQDPL